MFTTEVFIIIFISSMTMCYFIDKQIVHKSKV